MDGREVLVNILHEISDNLRVLFNWGRARSGDQLIRTRFDKWPRNFEPNTTTTQHGPATAAAEDVAHVIHRFAEIAAEHLANGQKVNDCRAELTRIQKELVDAEARLFHLKMSHKQLEDQRHQETRGRLDVITDLRSRLQLTVKRTASSLRLAKACSELAKLEWEDEIKRPIEERRLHFNTLGSRLKTLIKENATIEAQLTKCKEENEAEVVEVSTQMEDEIQLRQEMLDQLKRQVAEECAHLQKLEESLALVTVDYDVIMDRRRRQAEEELRKRLEERARERAAIKIQQWFRFYLFRTMKARKRRKKAKRKVSREVKKETVAVQQQQQQQQQQLQQETVKHHEITGEEVEETRATPVAVLVSTRKTIEASKSVDVCSDADQHESGHYNKSKSNKKKASKKGAVRSVTVRKASTKAAATGKQETAASAAHNEAQQAKSNSNSRGSQTDNRVPKTKRTYR